MIEVRIFRRLASYLSEKIANKPLPQIAQKVWYVATNLTRQFALFKLFAHPEFAALLHASPSFSYKYLGKQYLARGLTVAQRASCQFHHYRYLQTRCSQDMLQAILRGEVTVFDTCTEAKTYSIAMGMVSPFFFEGEMFLDFRAEGLSLFCLCFTIVPGSIVGSDAADVLLVARLQGARRRHAELSAAAKDLRDVSAAALLVAALQGVAEAFGIAEVAGVGSANQRSFLEDNADSFKRTYDDFFLSLGAAVNKAGFYHSPLPLPEKPLELVKANNRLRTKKRRALKQQVEQEVCRFLQNGVPGPAPAVAHKRFQAQMVDDLVS